MAAMAFANYKRRVSCAANFAQKQEVENIQFAADENKTVRHRMNNWICLKLKVINMISWSQVARKWSCDEDGVHISTKWLPIPRSFISTHSDPNPLKKYLWPSFSRITLARVSLHQNVWNVKIFIYLKYLQGSHFLSLWLGLCYSCLWLWWEERVTCLAQLWYSIYTQHSIQQYWCSLYIWYPIPILLLVLTLW